MEKQLVTVICLCYNHEKFVRNAIESVLNQTYAPIQLVIVDDASTDKSVSVIRHAIKDYPEIIFLALEENLGNCRAFNRGFELAKGDFIIDLAADDVLMPQRAKRGVELLEASGKNYGVQFSDARLTGEDGKFIRLHSDKFPHDSIPQGDIYKEVIGRYFINSPTMMIRREVLEALGGYDETLAYEDFDFWIRSSRTFFYCYSPEALIERRIVGNSMARQQYKRNSPQLISTLKICEKIKALNKNQEENKALRKRVFYEMRKAFAAGELRLVISYIRLYFSI